MAQRLSVTEITLVGQGIGILDAREQHIRTNTLIQAQLARLEIPPDLLKMIKTLSSSKPFGRQDRAFSECAPRLRIVAEIDAVVGGLEDEFVQADDFSFAERRDLERLVPTAGLLHHVLNLDRRSRGSVFFLNVMTFENLAGITVAQGGGSLAGYVEKHVYPD